VESLIEGVSKSFAKRSHLFFTYTSLQSRSGPGSSFLRG